MTADTVVCSRAAFALAGSHTSSGMRMFRLGVIAGIFAQCGVTLAGTHLYVQPAV